MDKETRTRHPSFGQLEISRVTSNKGVPLYGSSLRHSNYIQLSIHESEHVRTLHQNNYFPTKTVIEVDMSELQFAEAITNMNRGSGIPVTIARRDGKAVEDCPAFQEREKFNAEFAEDIKNILANSKKLLEKASELCDQKSVTKGQLNELKSTLQALQTDLDSNLQFVNKQFQRSVETTVSSAKLEIENFLNSTIKDMGIKALTEKYRAPQIEGKF